jgi:hypothetical protein
MNISSKPHEVTVISTGATQAAACEGLRKYILENNERLLTHDDLPDCIKTLAENSIANNADIVFTVNDKNFVCINDAQAEMDYYYMVELPA